MVWWATITTTTATAAEPGYSVAKAEAASSGINCEESSNESGCEICIQREEEA